VSSALGGGQRGLCVVWELSARWVEILAEEFMLHFCCCAYVIFFFLLLQSLRSSLSRHADTEQLYFFHKTWQFILGVREGGGSALVGGQRVV
jgi:hypothetical protein